MSVSTTRQEIAQIVAAQEITATTGDDLFTVVDLFEQQPKLRSFVTNPSMPQDSINAALDELLASRIGAEALNIVKALAELEWNSGRAFIEGLTDAAVRCKLLATDNLSDVQEELFRFSRLVTETPKLRSALTNDGISIEGRQKLVADLLGEKANPTTVVLAQRAVGYQIYEKRIGEILEIAADLNDHGIAIVTVAQPLTEAQKAKLKEQLTRIYGRDIDLQFEIDPSVLGGARIDLAGEVIDGTVAGKLENARRQIHSLDD